MNGKVNLKLIVFVYNGFVLITTDYEDFHLNDYKNTWGLKKGEYKYHA